jgi:hypothetical protein
MGSSRIKYGAQRVHLGRFTDPLSAALMYDAASRELYQDFAGCNFPDIPTAPIAQEQVKTVLTRYGLLT